jgi:AhpC/TSA family
MPQVTRRIAVTGLGLGLANLAGQGFAADPTFKVGAAAPDFSVADHNGRAVALTDLRGKTVVLEWTNPECPFVAKHYVTGNMQALQADARSKGVVWLTLSSAAPGNMGFVDGLEAAALMDARQSMPSAFLLDRDGRVMADYGITVALTMAVINPQGVLAYHGAIDDRPTAKPEDVAGAQNYVRAALSAVQAGLPVKPSQTRAYGCSAR